MGTRNACYNPNMPNFPKVSILIPARNEANNISKCLISLTESDYPNFDITVIDDGSSDNTGDVARSIGAESSLAIRVIRNDSLPSGWSGKNHALHIGQQTVDGEWLLFTDADTFHYPQSLSTAMRCVQEKNLDFLSYSPEQECVTFWEKVAQPMVFSFLARTFPLEKINNGSSPAAANGQYILVRRTAYETFNGHTAVKAELMEDVAMAKLARLKGLATGFYPGRGLVRTRMYSGFAEIWNGWTKGLFTLLDYKAERVSRAITVTIFEYLLPIFVLAIGLLLFAKFNSIAALVLTVVMMLVLASSLFRYYLRMQENGFPASSLFYFPLSAVLFIMLLIASLHRHNSKTIEWKGRAYSE